MCRSCCQMCLRCSLESTLSSHLSGRARQPNKAHTMKKRTHSDSDRRSKACTSHCRVQRQSRVGIPSAWCSPVGKSGPVGMGCTRPCCQDECDWTSFPLGMQAQLNPLLRSTSQHCNRRRPSALSSFGRCLSCTRSSPQILRSARLCPGHRPCSFRLQQRYLRATN